MGQRKITLQNKKKVAKSHKNLKLYYIYFELSFKIKLDTYKSVSIKIGRTLKVKKKPCQKFLHLIAKIDLRTKIDLK